MPSILRGIFRQGDRAVCGWLERVAFNRNEAFTLPAEAAIAFAATFGGKVNSI